MLYDVCNKTDMIKTDKKNVYKRILNTGNITVKVHNLPNIIF